jgi:autotransporter translocation and assembly factor TamB
MTDRIKIRSVSDRLRQPDDVAGYGESRRSIAKADGCAWGWGPTRTKKCRRAGLAAIVVAVLSFAPLAAAEKYQVHLSAMPFNDATQPIMTAGKGSATATLEGETLSISGTFAGLPARATKARLSLSRGPGIPGNPVVDLTLAGDVAGKVTGQIKLDPSQLAALRGRRLYIQIDSEKAPSGHLWGWLLEEHEIVGQDVPQKGPWFIPPFAVKTK